MAKNKKTVISIRAKANLPAKAGKRRPPNLASVRDSENRRQWVTTSSR